MHARGYMVEAEWDGDTLTARGTNKVGQAALRGGEAGDGDVQLWRDQLERVELKQARAMVNGNLIVHADGQRYQLHFRRKQAGEFEALARELQTAVGPRETQPAPTGGGRALGRRQKLSAANRGEGGCPNCGGTQFKAKRSATAKLVGGVAVGVGALAAPKTQVKCVGCGKTYRRG